MIPEIESSSDQESVDDVWSINDEQREYYLKQFQNIEPDVNGQITGKSFVNKNLKGEINIESKEPEMQALIKPCNLPQTQSKSDVKYKKKVIAIRKSNSDFQ